MRHTDSQKAVCAMTDFTQLIGLISAIVGTGAGTVIAQIYRENRNHRWDEERRKEQKADEDAKQKAQKAEEKDERERVAREVATKLDRDAHAADLTRAEIKHGIAAVGVKADAAFNEANHVNLKFDRVHDRLTDLNTKLVQQASTPQKVEVINAPLFVRDAPDRRKGQTE